MIYEDLNAHALRTDTSIYTSLKELITVNVERAYKRNERRVEIDTSAIVFSPGITSWFIADLAARGFKVTPDFRWERTEEYAGEICVLKNLVIEW